MEDKDVVKEKHSGKIDPVHIPWLDKFEEMTKKSEDPESPDIDFLTRIHELEGR